MTRDLLFTLSFIATRASAESADIGTTPFVRRGYRASPIGLVADEANKDAAKGCNSLRVTRGPVLHASYAGKRTCLRIGTEGEEGGVSLCRARSASTCGRLIFVSCAGGGGGGNGRGTTISIWPAECHSHSFDRYTADRQPTSAKG
jgi:hypothetical protein